MLNPQFNFMDRVCPDRQLGWRRADWIKTKNDYGHFNTAAGAFLPKLGAMFLFAFLIFTTPIKQIIDNVRVKSNAYKTMKYNRMVDDMFFYDLSYTINIICYIFVVVCTYMLFLTAPTADNLLLNVLALQFLIEVDNILCDTVLSDIDKKRLKDKMMLSYLLDGEQLETEWDDASCYCVKSTISYAGEVMGMGFFPCPEGWFCGFFDRLNSWLTVGTLIYYCSWLLCPLVAYCL